MKFSIPRPQFAIGHLKTLEPHPDRLWLGEWVWQKTDLTASLTISPGWVRVFQATPDEIKCALRQWDEAHRLTGNLSSLHYRYVNVRLQEDPPSYQGTISQYLADKEDGKRDN